MERLNFGADPGGRFRHDGDEEVEEWGQGVKVLICMRTRAMRRF